MLALPLLCVVAHASPLPPPLLDDIDAADGAGDAGDDGDDCDAGDAGKARAADQYDDRPPTPVDDASSAPDTGHRDPQTTFGDLVVLGAATGGVAVVSGAGALLLFALSSGSAPLVLVVPFVATPLTAGILAGGLDDVGVVGGAAAAVGSLCGGTVGAVAVGAFGAFLVLSVNPAATGESVLVAVIGGLAGAGAGAGAGAMAASSVAAIGSALGE